MVYTISYWFWVTYVGAPHAEYLMSPRKHMKQKKTGAESFIAESSSAGTMASGIIIFIFLTMITHIFPHKDIMLQTYHSIVHMSQHVYITKGDFKKQELRGK